MVMATPYLDEAERCTRVALLHEGRLLAQDEPARLQAGTGDVMVEVVVADPRGALRVLRDRLGGDRVQLFGDRLHVRLAEREPIDAFTARLDAAGVSATGVREITPTLEDVFIERLGRAPAAADRRGTGGRQG
jgi:ABC-2 type transport system ATP-binding protein